MSLFRNKHVIVAMLVAPVLAVLTYFATDHLVGEKATAAAANRSYPLQAMPNCRYTSGTCSLRNGDVQIDLQLRVVGDRVEIVLHSRHPVTMATLAALRAGDTDGDQVALEPMQDSKRWHGTVAMPVSELETIRLAIGIEHSLYYAETGTGFITARE